MIQPIEKPRIAVLGLSLELYKESLPGFMERLEKQLEVFKDELTSFATIESCRLCFLQTQVSEEIGNAEQSAVDALVLIPTCYTASLMTLLPVVRTRLPIVIWNTQEALEVKRSYSYDDLLMNHVTQGTQDVTNVLVRSGHRFGMESGHYKDATALGRLSEWLAAARATRFAGRLRVGLLGSPFQDMGDFGVDETRMATDWGPYTVHLPVGRFMHLLEQADDDQTAAIVAADRQAYEVDDDVTDRIHTVSARLELALRQLVGENELDAFTMNFKELIEDGRCPSMPFLGLNKLLGEGLGYAGEGNTMIAAHMAQMRQLCGVSNFTEIFTVDYKNRAMVMTHMQECNPALARRDRKIRLLKKDFWAPGIDPYVGMHFTLEPGPVTLSTITTERDGRFLYLAYETQIRDMPPFKSLDIPHWVVDLDEPVEDFLTRYSLAGGPHHLVATPGRTASALEKLGHLQGFRVRNLTPDT